MMAIKAHWFFPLLCLAVFGLSIFVVVTAKMGILNGNSTGLAGNKTVGEKTKTSQLFLEITNPEDGSSVADESLLIQGKTLVKAEVFVNEIEARADVNGNFSVKIGLDEGENLINILVNDLDGSYIEKQISVSLETF